MLAGYLPYAESIEDSDVIIISKDGVHLYQASAAGIGGGLRYWVETEDEIYRVADITALSALTYDPTEPVWKYTWHGAPMSESNIQHAVYTALDSSGKQPDYLLPEDSELSKAVNDPTVPVNPINIKPKVLSPYYSGNEQGASEGPPDVNGFDYCRDFNQLYIGWLPINVTNWFIDPYTEAAIGTGCYIYDLAFEYQHWYKTTPTIFAGTLLPTVGSSTSYGSDEELYNAIKSGVLDEWDEHDPSGQTYWQEWPNRGNYCIYEDPVHAADGEAWIDSLRNETYDTSSGGQALMETCLTKIGYSDDPVAGGETGQHVGPGIYKHEFYDRRLGKIGNYRELESAVRQREQFIEMATQNWEDAYDPDPSSPTYNPTPGGFTSLQSYIDWYLNAFITSGGGSGLMSAYSEVDATTNSPETREVPFIVIASCVGYYPDYELKPLSGDNDQDIDFPRSKWHNYPYNFPGFSHTTQQGYAYKPSYGETANFSDEGSIYTRVSGTTVDRVLRGPSICVDYKDDNGYVWEIGLFAANPHWIDGDTLSIGTESPIVVISGSETYNISSLNKIDLDSTFTHWSMNPSLLDNVHDATVMSRDQDTVRIYKYSVLNEGAGLSMINSARNVAATIVRETGLKAFKAFEGSQITVRTNIGVNTNEGFKTGLEVVDFDDVKKFEETSYVDPVTGAGWFKGTLTANGGLVQKKLKAGAGITITPGEKEDTISSTGGGGAVDVDTILALMEKGPGITPIKDALNNKIRIDLKHDVNVKISSTDYISIERSYKEDPEEPGTMTNEYVDEVDLKMTAIRNDIYSAGHMVKGTGGIDLTPNTGTGQVTISTDTISNISVNGDPVEKTYDSETGKYQVNLQISSGEDDYDIPLPIPDYVNREVIYASTYAQLGDTFTAPSDGVLYLMAHTSGVCCLPVTIGSMTYKLGVRASYSSYNESGNMLPMKEGHVATFGTRYPTNGWVNTTSQSGYILWFIPYVKVNSADLDGNYILPSPNYDVNDEVITASTVPSRSSGNYYTWTAPVDGIIRAIGNTAGYYTVEPLDDNDASVGIYYLNHVNSSGEGVQFDYLPVRKGQKYKMQRDGVSKGDIVVNAFETTSDISEVYLPYVDYDNPVLITPTADGTYHDIYDSSWDANQPALLVDSIVGTYNFMASILYVKEGTASDLAFVLQSKSAASSGLCDSSYNSIPLTRKSDYSPSYSIAASYYGSGDITLLKYVKFEPPVAPKRILYDGQNLVDSNGDVDLTFLKQLIDSLDARITALGG